MRRILTRTHPRQQLVLIWNNMAKQQSIVVKGEVSEALPNAMFRVVLDDTGMEILCNISGKMRMYNIRVMEGDRVEVEMSPYDLSRGRISKRL